MSEVPQGVLATVPRQPVSGVQLIVDYRGVHVEVNGDEILSIFWRYLDELRKEVLE